jgi:hypothetical protein
MFWLVAAVREPSRECNRKPTKSPLQLSILISLARDALSAFRPMVTGHLRHRCRGIAGRPKLVLERAHGHLPITVTGHLSLRAATHALFGQEVEPHVRNFLTHLGRSRASLENLRYRPVSSCPSSPVHCFRATLPVEWPILARKAELIARLCALTDFAHHGRPVSLPK